PSVIHAPPLRSGLGAALRDRPRELADQPRIALLDDLEAVIGVLDRVLAHPFSSRSRRGPRTPRSSASEAIAGTSKPRADHLLPVGSGWRQGAPIARDSAGPSCCCGSNFIGRIGSAT